MSGEGALTLDSVTRALEDEEEARKMLKTYVAGLFEKGLKAFLLGLFFASGYFLKKFLRLKREVIKPTPSLVLMELGIIDRADLLDLFTKRQRICLSDEEYLAFLRMQSQLRVLAKRSPTLAPKIISILNSLQQSMMGNCFKTYSIDALINYMANIHMTVRELIEEIRIGQSDKAEEEGEEP